MSKYDEFLRQEKKEADKKAQAYEVERRAQAVRQMQETAQTYAQQREVYRSQAQLEKRDTDERYARMYDANAVDELVARRHAAEAIANSNLTQSGLNTTQHTAISLRRMRADSETRASKQAAVLRIMQALDEREAQLTSQEAADRRSLMNATEEAVQTYRERAEKQAADTAQRRYKEAKESPAAASLPEGVGTIQADKTYTPSYVTVSTNAMMRQRRHGDAAASDYLHNMFCAGHISFAQWKQLHEKLSVVPCEGWADGSVRAIMRIVAEVRGEKEARLFVEHLRERNILTAERADGLMQELYAME